MHTKVHYSSKSDEWETPDDLFARLNGIFKFNLDACASEHNAKCEQFYSTHEDALEKKWTGTVWMNPPYSRVEAFMRKAYEQSQAGATVVCLVPGRLGSRWWRRYALRGQVIQLPGRLKFKHAKHSAPFPSVLVIFWPDWLGDAIRPMDLPQ